MAALGRFTRGSSDDEVGAPDSSGGATSHPVPAEGEGIIAAHTADRSEEEGLRARLTEDPNDVQAFDRLAGIVRTHATEGHEVGDPQREANDSVWALAEEIAHNGRAWYPLIELARLSIDDDRDQAMRRLATAAERDPTGEAVAQGLAMLRDGGHPVDALNLGVGHWRPREHVVEAGRQIIAAAVESERFSEARRHLEALAAHPDEAAVERVRQEFVSKIPERVPRPDEGFVDAGPTADPSSQAAPVDVRDKDDKDDKGGSKLLGFLRR